MTSIVYVRIIEHDEETDLTGAYFVVDKAAYTDEVPYKVPFTTVLSEIYEYMTTYLPRAGKDIALTANIEATVTYDIPFAGGQDYVLIMRNS